MRKSIIIASLFSGLCAPVMAQQSAHVHGLASINLAIDDDALELEFVSPADGIVGFEYEPSNAAEHKAVKDAMAALRKPESLFTLPDSANCDLAEVEVERHAKGEHDEHDHDDHNHDKDEDHAHDDHGHDDNKAMHSEFHAHYQFDCNGSAIREIELTLFANWPRIETLQLQALTPTGQTGGNISARDPVIRLP